MSVCTSPVSIFNPSKTYRPSTDKRLLNVPCGHCPNCLASKQLSWTTRLYYEWQATKNLGGTAFYYTLTYNDAHLPYAYGIPVFDKSDCQKFFKNLGTKLERSYGQRMNFSRFLVSEYGHEKHRPHYHFLLFAKFPIETWKMEKFVADSWVDKHGYSRGFIAPGSLGAVVESISAINYVAKYIMKDMDFDDYYQTICERYELFNPPCTLDECADLTYYYIQKEKDLKKFKPFFLPSKHLGESILAEVQTRKSSLEASRLIIPDTQIKGEYKEVPIPLYIKRKLYYNESCPINGKRIAEVNGKTYSTYSVSYVLNDKGQSVKLKNLDKQIDEQVQRFSSYFAYVDSPETYKVLSCSVADARNLVYSLLDGRSLRSVCVYAAVYCGRADSGLNDYHTDYARFIDPYHVDGEKTVKYSLYNSRPEFESYDDILEVFAKFSKIESYVRTNKRIDKYNSTQVVLSQMQPHKYRSARLIPNIPLNLF